MDFSVLRSVVFGALGKFESASLQVLSNVFTSTHGIVTAARAATHVAVNVTFGLAATGLRAIESLTYEVVVLAFNVLNAVVAAVIGRTVLKMIGPTAPASAPAEELDAQI